MSQQAHIPLSTQSLTETVQTIRSHYHAQGKTDWDIGNGLCENFADDVLDAWAGPGWVHIEGTEGCPFSLRDSAYLMIDLSEWDWPLIDRLLGERAPALEDRPIWDKVAAWMPTHIWIEHEGRAYDCEHPEGVASFFELNFFLRKFERAKSGDTLF